MHCMSLSYAQNPFAMNTGMAPAAGGIMPLKLLIRQAGVAGFLLLLGEPLRLVTTRQRAEGYDAVDGSAMIQIAYALVCFLYAVHYLASPQNRGAARILFRNPVVFLLLYILLCGISALWSPNPAYTAFMAFQCLAFLALVIAALSDVNRRCSAQDVIEWVILWAVWTILWSVLVNMRAFYGWRFLLNPFGAGRLATGVFFFPALYLSKRRLFGWLIVAFAFGSGSRKNYWGILPGLLFGAWLGDRKSKVLAFVFAATLAISVLLVGAEKVVQNTLFRGKEGIGWEYTTGRDRIWATAWELCMQRPLLGYGFVAGERDMLMETRGANVISVHNVFFSAFMGVGFLGPLLLFPFFLGACVPCLKRTVPPSWRFAFTATVLMVFVVSMTGPGLGGRVYGAWLASVIVMTMIAILCKTRVQELSAWVVR